MLQIRHFTAADTDIVIGLILPIQREEFGVSVTAEDQPDLREIETFYQSGSGDFWLAEIGGTVVGTIGLKDIGGGQAALRKMFVAVSYRGKEYGVAAALLETLLAHARSNELRTIFLGTTDKFLAAHRFYEKNGFSVIPPDDLPIVFPRMAVDSRFYKLAL